MPLASAYKLNEEERSERMLEIDKSTTKMGRNLAAMKNRLKDAHRRSFEMAKTLGTEMDRLQEQGDALTKQMGLETKKKLQLKSIGFRQSEREEIEQIEEELMHEEQHSKQVVQQEIIDQEAQHRSGISTVNSDMNAGIQQGHQGCHQGLQQVEVDEEPAEQNKKSKVRPSAMPNALLKLKERWTRETEEADRQEAWEELGNVGRAPPHFRLDEQEHYGVPLNQRSKRKTNYDDSDNENSSNKNNRSTKNRRSADKSSAQKSERKSGGMSSVPEQQQHHGDVHGSPQYEQHLSPHQHSGSPDHQQNSKQKPHHVRDDCHIPGLNEAFPYTSALPVDGGLQPIQFPNVRAAPNYDDMGQVIRDFRADLAVRRKLKDREEHYRGMTKSAKNKVSPYVRQPGEQDLERKYGYSPVRPPSVTHDGSRVQATTEDGLSLLNAKRELEQVKQQLQKEKRSKEALIVEHENMAKTFSSLFINPEMERMKQVFTTDGDLGPSAIRDEVGQVTAQKEKILEWFDKRIGGERDRETEQILLDESGIKVDELEYVMEHTEPYQKALTEIQSLRSALEQLGSEMMDANLIRNKNKLDYREGAEPEEDDASTEGEHVPLENLSVVNLRHELSGLRNEISRYFKEIREPPEVPMMDIEYVRQEIDVLRKEVFSTTHSMGVMKAYKSEYDPRATVTGADVSGAGTAGQTEDPLLRAERMLQEAADMNKDATASITKRGFGTNRGASSQAPGREEAGYGDDIKESGGVYELFKKMTNMSGSADFSSSNQYDMLPDSSSGSPKSKSAGPKKFGRKREDFVDADGEATQSEKPQKETGTTRSKSRKSVPKKPHPEDESVEILSRAVTTTPTGSGTMRQTNLRRSQEGMEDDGLRNEEVGLQDAAGPETPRGPEASRAGPPPVAESASPTFFYERHQILSPGIPFSESATNYTTSKSSTEADHQVGEQVADPSHQLPGKHRFGIQRNKLGHPSSSSTAPPQQLQHRRVEDLKSAQQTNIVRVQQTNIVKQRTGRQGNGPQTNVQSRKAWESPEARGQSGGLGQLRQSNSQLTVPPYEQASQKPPPHNADTLRHRRDHLDRRSVQEDDEMMITQLERSYHDTMNLIASSGVGNPRGGGTKHGVGAASSSTYHAVDAGPPHLGGHHPMTGSTPNPAKGYPGSNRPQHASHSDRHFSTLHGERHSAAPGSEPQSPLNNLRTPGQDHGPPPAYAQKSISKGSENSNARSDGRSEATSSFFEFDGPSTFETVGMKRPQKRITPPPHSRRNQYH